MTADIHQTYLGAEMQFVMAVGFAVGAYLRVEGRADSNRALLAASVPFGL